MSREADWSAGTWDGSRQEMIRQNLQLTVRERLERIGELRQLNDELAEAEVMHDEDGGHDLLLAGCRPIPLASYLKSLGVLRLVSEQADPETRGRWTDEGFRLSTALDRERLVDFFLREYRPTPILAPWNGGSGFFPKDNQSGIGPMEAGSAERFSSLRATIARIRTTLARLDLLEGMRPEAKEELLIHLRSVLDDEALAWFDAAVLLTEESPRYPPLLGTGGNDGRLDFTNNFLQRIVQLFDPSSGESIEEAGPLLRGALFGEAVPGLWGAAMGQYAPADTAGPNASTGFGGETLMNPWDFVLMLEGALLFAASAARRLESTGGGQLAYPFTVRPTGVGGGAADPVDERSSRGEVWMPLWRRPVSLVELRALLGEGRAVLGDRSARDGLDFARAVAKLGVDRGISEFVRYGFLMRNGKAFLASPLTRVKVRSNPTGDLIDQLDEKGWLTRFQRLSSSGGNAPARLVSLGRRLQDGLFRIARGEGGARVMLTRVQDVLINLGEIQRYLASAPNARESIPPIPLLGKDWVEAGNDESPEFFIAAALAGLHAEKRVSGDVEGRGSDGMRMATHFAPVTGDYSRHDSGWWEESREVVWSEGELDRALLAVLERRLLRAEMDGNWEKPLESDFGVPLHSVEGWLAAGKRFDRRIADLLQGLVLARIPHRLDGGSRYGGSENVVLPAAYFLLKPFFATERRLRAVGALGPERLLPLPLAVVRMIAAEPGWMKKDQPEQGVLPFALRRLHLAGVGSLKRRDKGRSEEDEIDGGDARLSPALSGIQCTGVEGRRLLAALLVPISNADLEEVIRRISMPPRKRRSSASAVQP